MGLIKGILNSKAQLSGYDCSPTALTNLLCSNTYLTETWDDLHSSSVVDLETTEEGTEWLAFELHCGYHAYLNGLRMRRIEGYTAKLLKLDLLDGRKVILSFIDNDGDWHDSYVIGRILNWYLLSNYDGESKFTLVHKNEVEEILSRQQDGLPAVGYVFSKRSK